MIYAEANFGPPRAVDNAWKPSQSEAGPGEMIGGAFARSRRVGFMIRFARQNSFIQRMARALASSENLRPAPDHPALRFCPKRERRSRLKSPIHPSRSEERRVGK